MPTTDDRRHCSTCACLDFRGGCVAAQVGDLPGAAWHHRPIDWPPRRCIAYAPLPDDPDQRSGRERWPDLQRTN